MSTASAISPRQGKIAGLELGRFAFALAVVIYHYLWYGPTIHRVAGAPAPDLFILGRFAVEAFFVISGYVIALTAASRNALDFVVARFGRLWPAMAVCATVTLLSTWPDTLPVPWLKAVTLVGMLFETGGRIDPSYWSITVELRFYAAVALLLLVFRRLPDPRVLAITWMAASFMAWAVPALRPWTLFPYSAFFIFGLLLYARDKGARHTLALAVPTLVLAAVQVAVEHQRIASLGSSFKVAAAALALPSAIFLAVFLLRFRSNWPPLAAAAKVLGGMSYPLYLVHQVAGYELINRLQPAIGRWPAVLLTMLAALVIAYAVAQWVEPPARTFIRHATQAVGMRRAASHSAPT